LTVLEGGPQSTPAHPCTPALARPRANPSGEACQAQGELDAAGEACQAQGELDAAGEACQAQGELDAAGEAYRC
jgi:hypothetical protein